MQIAICDECREETQIIEECLKKYSQTKSLSFSVTQYTNGEELIYEIEDGRHFDILFIENTSSGNKGISTAKKIRGLNYSGEIIFTAESGESAVDGYEVNACGYIVKPLNRTKLLSALERAADKFSADVYRFRQRSDIITLALNEILFIESNNSKCIIHSKDGHKHTVYTKLSDIESELNDCRFLRCHQSYLVNMNHIVKADKCFELTNGDNILIRQRSLKEMKKRYYEYIGTT